MHAINRSGNYLSLHTSTLGVACTERTNTTTVRTSFNGGGANTALAATMLRSTKRSTQLRSHVNNAGGRLPPCCIFIVIVSSSHQLIFFAASSRSTIIIFFIAASSRSTASGVPVQLFFSFPASSCSTSTTTITAGASSWPPEGIDYSLIATSSNDVNTKPMYFPRLTSSPSTISFLKAPVFEGHGTSAAKRLSLIHI